MSKTAPNYHSVDSEAEQTLLRRRVTILLSCVAPLFALNSVLCLIGGLHTPAAIYALVTPIFMGVAGLLYRGKLQRYLQQVAHGVLLIGGLLVFGMGLKDGPSSTITLLYLSAIPAIAAHMLGRQAALFWFGATSALILLAHTIEFLVPLSQVPPSYLIGNSLSSVVLNGGLSYFAIAGRRIADQHILEVSAAKAEILHAHEELQQASRAMSTILDNVLTGFFVVNADLVVQGEASRSCQSLFRLPSVVGCHLFDLLPDVSERDRDDVELQLAQAFGDILPPDVALAQLPSHFPHGERTLHLQGREIRNNEGTISGVLFTVTDHTELLASQRDRDHHALLVRLMKERGAFCAFLREANTQLGAAEASALAGEEERCRELLHTLKGNTGAYGLVDLMSLIHHTEELVVITEVEVQAVRRALEDFLEDNVSVIGIRLRDAAAEASSYTLRAEQLLDLQDRMGQIAPEVLGPLRRWIREVSAQPVRLLLGPLEEMIQRIAKRQEKQVAFCVRGAETLVDVARLAPVFQSLPHLLRNAVDHGLETPEDRGDKPATGSLQLEITSDAGDCRIEVRDDGRGIPEEKLVKKAVERGIYTFEQAARLTQKERLALIFSAGVSTAEAVTDVSGRGVGMGAVRRAVEDLGGTIEVQSVQGKGTTVVLYLPPEDLWLQCVPATEIHSTLRAG